MSKAKQVKQVKQRPASKAQVKGAKPPTQGGTYVPGAPVEKPTQSLQPVEKPTQTSNPGVAGKTKGV